MLTALVMLGACVVAAVSAVQWAVGEPALVSFAALAESAHDLQWRDVAPAVAGAVAALIGVLLVFAALIPGKPLTIALSADDFGEHAVVSRTSVRSALKSAAKVDGVSNAAITLRRKRIHAVVRTNRTSIDGVADAVRSALQQCLTQIGLATQLGVTVKVKAARRTK
ncbi:DUF6286 domain-containing protein [Kibdelosporangium aridum]|uniref:DUF6286 domain-containing protein n=1 Tax=Kibdelosporangium aridum TaxID=2030 RepID=UPI000A0099E3|nr:DUF6286 domain-containing protein [Kibdelosporangium aridum]